ncbi:21285_t:CDS:2, partial [Racocetra persica]
TSIKASKICLTNKISGKQLSTTSSLIQEAHKFKTQNLQQEFLSVDSNKENEPLSLYFGDPTLNLWASWISEDVVDNCFPEILLVKHIFEAFMLVSGRIETIKKQMPSVSKTVATNNPPITKVVTSKKTPKTNSKSPSTLFATRKSKSKTSSSNEATTSKSKTSSSNEATTSKTQSTKTLTSQVQKKNI